MEQYTIIHDRSNATEHPLAGNPNIYTAKVESNGQYDLVPENPVTSQSPNTTALGRTAPAQNVAETVTDQNNQTQTVPDIMEYLSSTSQGQNYVFNEAASNYGDISAY
jgi:hypothetical protein